MELRHEFTVPVPVDDVWRILLDIERVAPCMPGASLDGVDGDTASGSVKVKVGPVTLTYRGTAVFLEKDAAAHRIVLSAQGREVRGQGTAKATVTGTLTAHGGGTAVDVVTDLAVTGRPAQIGRGVMAEVSDRVIGQFADCLAERFAVGPAEPEIEFEPVDLLRAVGVPLAERAGAALVAAALAALVVIAVRRKRRTALAHRPCGLGSAVSRGARPQGRRRTTRPPCARRCCPGRR